jgi:uncharacterized surface protein with fasciclin (FAS1) repeats
MKTTAKTIFSLMAAGFVLTTINARSSAQTSEPSAEKPLSPAIMKILCERSPLNSRCQQSSTPGGAAMPAGDTAPKDEMKGGKKDEMTPSTPAPATGDPTMPSTPPPSTGSPSGGGTLPPTGTPVDPAAPTAPVEAPTMAPAPVEAPVPGTSKPYQSDSEKLSNPVGPSSALPSVPTKLSAEPSSTPKPSSSASELTDPAKTKAPTAEVSSPTKPAASSKPTSTASEAAPTEKAPAAEVPSSSSPDAGSKSPASSTEPSTPAAEPAAPGTPSAAEAPASGSSVVDVVGSNAKLKTLSAALKAAGLDEALAGKGPFTIFAPTDEAFAALPPEALKDLLKPENKAKLAALLTYHVIAGKVESKTLKPGETATVQGQPLTVKVEGSKVMVNDATVTQPDVAASNGVIHLIDKVILPSAS